MADLNLELSDLASRLTQLGKHGSAGVIRRAQAELVELRERAEEAESALAAIRAAYDTCGVSRQTQDRLAEPYIWPDRA